MLCAHRAVRKLDLRFVINGIPNTRSPVERKSRGDSDSYF